MNSEDVNELNAKNLSRGTKISSAGQAIYAGYLNQKANKGLIPQERMDYLRTLCTSRKSKG
jgi:hypothetical protein